MNPFKKLVITSVLFVLITVCVNIYSRASVWTTSTSGSVTTLSNWTDGTGSPTSFLTPGDTWTVTMPMIVPAITWTLGAASTLTIESGGALDMSVSGTSNIVVDGKFVVSGGTLMVGGTGVTCNITITDSAIISGGVLGTIGVASNFTLNANGTFNMTGGTIGAGGTGANVVVNAKGNSNFSGPSAMTNTGTGCTSSVHFMIPSTTFSMLISNTSTGVWSGTNVYVDAGSYAKLAGNFNTSSGSSVFGFIVNGILDCPAPYLVNGNGIFTVNGSGTLAVGSALGINGAITTSGTKTFNSSASYTYNGTAPQATGTFLPASLVSPSTLKINNSTGVTLTQSVITTGVLALTNGILYTGSFTMSTPGAASAVTGPGGSSYVDGTLIKTITGLTSLNFEVGDIGSATMSFLFSSAGTAGSIAVKVTHGLHPNVATSGLMPSNMVNKYWNVALIGAAGPTSILPHCIYPTADLFGGSISNICTQKYSGSAWLGTALCNSNSWTSVFCNTSPVSPLPIGSVSGDYIFGKVICSSSPITGIASICQGESATFTHPLPCGTWVSGNAGVASVTLSTGVVTGVTSGTAVISYLVGTCIATTVVTITPLPSAGIITGMLSACIGATTTLSNTVSGGTWSSSNSAVGTVASSGSVSGITAGSTTISYSVTNSCGTAVTSVNVIVDPVPAVASITGVDSICVGFTQTLACPTIGGTWSNSNTTLAAVSIIGVVTALAPGYDTILYTVSNTCDTVSAKFPIKLKAEGCPTSANQEVLNSSGLSISPNPSYGNFTISISGAENESVQLFLIDIIGRKIIDKRVFTNNAIDLKLNEPPGLYILSALTQKEKYVVKLFLK